MNEEYVECLEARIVRLYIMKHYTINWYQVAKVCPPEVASEILRRYGLIRYHQGFRGSKGMFDHPKSLT